MKTFALISLGLVMLCALIGFALMLIGAGLGLLPWLESASVAGSCVAIGWFASHVMSNIEELS